MKKVPFTILVFLLLCNTYGVFGQQITNGNMEEWAELESGNKQYPIGWTTRNHLEDNPQANYGIQVDDPFKGAKAIMLQSFRVSPEVSLGSFLSLGAFNEAKPSNRGIAFTERPLSLNFRYKYFTNIANPSGFYQAKATLRLTRWDAANQTAVVVGSAEYSISDKANNYQTVELDIIYEIGAQPDSLVLIFTTPSNPDDQVRFTLDDIHLVFDTPASDDNPQISDKVELYPNPASSFLNIEQHQDFDESQLLVFDALGQLQIERNLSARVETVDIVGLNTGFYFYQIRRENELVKTGRFLKSIK